MPSPLDEYVGNISRGLRRMPKREREEEITEIRAHLEALIAAHTATGMDEAMAARSAIQQFGTDATVSRGLRGTAFRGRLVAAIQSWPGAFVTVVLTCIAANPLWPHLFAVIDDFWNRVGLSRLPYHAGSIAEVNIMQALFFAVVSAVAARIAGRRVVAILVPFWLLFDWWWCWNATWVGGLSIGSAMFPLVEAGIISGSVFWTTVSLAAALAMSRGPIAPFGIVGR